MQRAHRGVLGLLAAWWLLALPAPAPAADAPVYQVGIIPQAPPVAMFEKWGPLLARISERAGVPLKAKLYDNMGDFERSFLEGAPDLLFAHPAMYVAARKAQGYIPLVRDRRELSGQIFVRIDSPYRTVSDLAGKRLAFVGEKSFCTILVHAALEAMRPAARLTFDKSFHGSTRNVLRMVLLDKADAGASLDAGLELEDAESRRLIRPVLISPPFAPHPLAAHPRVPPEVRRKVAQAVLQMALDEPDRRLLAAIRMPDPLLADYERDYRPLEPR